MTSGSAQVDIRVGTDIVEIERIGKSIRKEAFVNKVFATVEIDYCQQKAKPEASFAARFAAKEAFFKALGTGLYTEGMGPQDVWVENDASGRPYLKLSMAAQNIVNQRGGQCKIDVSLAHDGPLAIATVV
ncbi:MAG: holo-[acyl-carrier-protein] synthase, partial [Pseudomonadota bacterium]